MLKRRGGHNTSELTSRLNSLWRAVESLSKGPFLRCSPAEVSWTTAEEEQQVAGATQEEKFTGRSRSLLCPVLVPSRGSEPA